VRTSTWTFALLLLAAATAAAFLPVLGNGFVWDDGANVVHNPHLEKLDSDLVRWAFTGFRLGHYQPLTWLSLALDRAVWGPRAAGVHLTSLLLHVANVLLFAAVARRLLREARCGDCRIAALIAAAVFALHPLRVESVAWATERRDLLAGVFFLLALLAYLAMARRDREGGSRLAWGAAAVVAFALSLLAKALALGLPVVLLVLDVYPLRRWRPGDGRGAAVRLAAEKVPFFALSIACGLAALAAQAESGALVGIGRYGWVERLFQAAYGALFYPRAIVAGAWSPLYERPTALDPWEPRFLLSALAFAAVTAALLALRRRFPAGLAAWVAYLALLAPVSGVAQSGVQLVADRYAYLAGLGFALLLGAGAGAAWEAARRPARRVAPIAVGAAVVAVLALWGALTFRQCRVWRDDATLWRHVVAYAPSAMGFNNLGALALRGGDRRTALPYLRRAVEVAPGFGLPWRNLLALLEAGGSDLDRGELARTAAALEASLPHHAHAATAWTTVALAHLALDRRDAARRHLARAVEVNPDYAPAWRRLAILQLGDGRHGDCRTSFAQAVRLEPADAGSWTGLGLCLEGSGDGDGARRAFERATALDPGAATARRRLQALGAGEAP
jgi:tetratricopeptide (TPR) repeat protein